MSIVARSHDEEGALARAADASPGSEIEDSRPASRLGELTAHFLAAIAVVMPGIGPIVADGPLAAGLGEAAGHVAHGADGTEDRRTLADALAGVAAGAEIIASNLVAAPAGQPKFSTWLQGTPFLSQLHDDLSAILDGTLTSRGDDPAISGQINNHIRDRLVPALAGAGSQRVLVLWQKRSRLDEERAALGLGARAVLGQWPAEPRRCRLGTGEARDRAVEEIGQPGEDHSGNRPTELTVRDEHGSADRCQQAEEREEICRDPDQVKCPSDGLEALFGLRAPTAVQHPRGPFLSRDLLVALTMSAVREPRPASTCRSRQFTDALSLPPTNHLA